jgi:hypothetical protein
MTKHDDMERWLRAAAAGMASISPSADQAELILARRARGDRVAIPLMLGSWRRLGLWAAALAAVAAGVFLLLYAPLRQETDSSKQKTPSTPVFVTGSLMAQPSPHPMFPALGSSVSLSGRRLQAGTWVYSAEMPGNQASSDSLAIYSVVQSEHSGMPAWLVLAGKQLEGKRRVFTDSMWLDRESLQVIALHGDTVSGWQPVPSEILALLQGAHLSADWKASVAMLKNAADSIAVWAWFNLQVYGAEDVQVPAGSFVCWKVGFMPDKGFYFWMSKDGWLIKQGMGREPYDAYGKMNLYLLGQENPLGGYELRQTER